MTLHHNVFDGLGQRTPRVRFGLVHVYNNYYRIVNTPKYGYSWGVRRIAIYAENNYFKTDDTVALAKIIGNYKGTVIYNAGTRVNDKEGRPARPVQARRMRSRSPARSIGNRLSSPRWIRSKP